MKKLYIVAVSFEYAVLAENAADAADLASMVVDDVNLADDCIDSVAVCDFDNPMALGPRGWTPDTLVYGAGGEDITWAQAVEAERKRQQAETDGLPGE